ncbi:hypothetical protein [Salinicoccus halodurans]|uniref:Uncharacterized protein n=1 Tax=Salinicoccus halodurans TaxID=407035 RepID=A0AA94HCK0_9STAP|nr:hypothetical protein [Salinicoccus halodurans]SFK57555.1 hypothetical protein SAMN05216235_0535 [Salinicoccus halodurans]
MNNIEVINKVPQFIDFFDTSREEYLDQEGRFELWKETYNFAAVPPGGGRTETCEDFIE